MRYAIISHRGHPRPRPRRLHRLPQHHSHYLVHHHIAIVNIVISVVGVTVSVAQERRSRQRRPYGRSEEESSTHERTFWKGRQRLLKDRKLTPLPSSLTWLQIVM